MPKFTTNGWQTKESLMDREPFTTHGALRAEYGGSPWNVGRLPEPWATQYAADARVEKITYTVLSYNTPIGWVLEDGTVVIPPVKYSITTSGHQSTVRHALDVANMSWDAKVSIRDHAQRERGGYRDHRRTAADARALAADADGGPDSIQVEARAPLPVPAKRDFAPVRMEYSESYSERQGWASSTVRGYASGVFQDSLYN